MSGYADPPKGRPFQKGDARINRKGRPKSFDGLRALTQMILHEKVKSKDGSIVMSRLEIILREMAASKDPRQKQWLVEVGFGKVPQKVDVDAVVEYIVETPDGN